MKLFGDRWSGAHGDADSWALGITPAVLATGLCCALAMLVWLGYVSTSQWRRQSHVLLQQRQAEALALTSTALTRDMKGAWTNVIAPLNVFELEEDVPYDFMRTAALAFARFPYPESFVIWKSRGAGSGSTFVFNRTERLPPWDHHEVVDEPFPVALSRDPAALAAALDDARRIRPNARFVSVNVMIDGMPYQIIAHRMFSTMPPHPLDAMVAFTVNMTWLTHEYFGPLLRQVAQIGGNQDALALSVSDSDGRVVATSGTTGTTGGDLQRTFPLLFVEPAVAATPGDAPIQEWTLHVNPTANSPLLLAQNSTRQMFFLMVLAAAISTTALLMAVRAIRASAMLASMKSEFVTAVTHELKTPVAAIRLVGDTLAQRRYDSVDTVAEYAELLSHEAARLSHSIDGLLTYAKYTTTKHAPGTLPALRLPDVVDEALDSLRPMLDRMQFDVSVDVPTALPAVAADRAAMNQVLECLIDNAVKYSGDVRRVTITAVSTGDSRVRLSVADSGIGISPADLGRVFDRFYRGQNATAGGSGLGLTIARRIVQAHGGTIAVHSTLGTGTTVELTLPAAPQS